MAKQNQFKSNLSYCVKQCLLLRSIIRNPQYLKQFIFSPNFRIILNLRFLQAIKPTLGSQYDSSILLRSNTCSYLEKEENY